jgi:hypothetical protein
LAALSPRLTPTGLAAKKRFENIAQAKAVLATTIKLSTLVWIGEHLVGVRYQLELLGRLRVRVHIRVQFTRKFAICLLYLISAGIGTNAKHLIVIAQELPSKILLKYLATALTDAMFPW